jgi:hypothetical protein
MNDADFDEFKEALELFETEIKEKVLKVQKRVAKTIYLWVIEGSFIATPHGKPALWTGSFLASNRIEINKPVKDYTFTPPYYDVPVWPLEFGPAFPREATAGEAFEYYGTAKLQLEKLNEVKDFCILNIGNNVPHADDVEYGVNEAIARHMGLPPGIFFGEKKMGPQPYMIYHRAWQKGKKRLERMMGK